MALLTPTVTHTGPLIIDGPTFTTIGAPRVGEPYYGVYIASTGAGVAAPGAVFSKTGNPIPGLSFTPGLIPGTLIVTGIPLKVGGSYNFAISASDATSGLTGSLAYVGASVGLGITPIGSVLPPVLPVLPYRVKLNANGGSGSYVFANTDATGTSVDLPRGFYLSSDGWLTGQVGINANSQFFESQALYFTAIGTDGNVGIKEYNLPRLFS
jgi:hypothetical protein